MPWIYIGSYKGIERVNGILKKNRRRFIGRDIEDITDSVRDNFVDYIGKLSSYQKDEVLWYSSRMASRSVSQTSMFHQYVYQKFLEMLSEKEAEDILVVTDDAELIHNIRELSPRRIRVLSSVISGGGEAWDRFRSYLRITRYFLLWLVCKPFKNKRLKKFNVFIHSWVDERVFSELPDYKDSYFGNLESFLNNVGYCVARLAPLFLPLKYIFRLRKRFANVIYPLAYLTFNDFIRAISTTFTVMNCEYDSTSIKDLKILNFLTRNEAIKENCSKRFLDCFLLFYSYKKLRHEINNSASFIYPFENQPWEKMFNLALNKFNRIAYQHSTIPSNWLDYRISRYDRTVPLPDVILTTGKQWSFFLKEYYKGLTIEEAGALRFPHLLGGQQRRKMDTQSKNIVVALPISPSISISLQKSLLACLDEADFMDYTVRIKPHPYLPKSACFERAFSIHRNCRFVEDNIDELLKDCTLLITSGSTVAFESTLSGIKTLYFIPEEVSLGIEHFIREHLFIVYEKDFLKGLKEALKSSSSPEVNREDFFSYPDYSIFARYLSKNIN